MPIDAYVFFRNLYTKPHDADEEVNVELISTEALEIFAITCEETLKELKKGGKKHDTRYPFVDFNKKLQDKLNVLDKIRSLIYDNFDTNKFLKDSHTGKTRIHPKYLNNIKEFNELKQLVFHCADKTEKVDIELLQSLIHQVDLRVKCLQVATKLGTLDIGKDENEMRQDSLFELSMCEPKSVEEQLADESLILDTIDSKINGLVDSLSQFSKDVQTRFDIMQRDIDILKRGQVVNQNSTNVDSSL